MSGDNSDDWVDSANTSLSDEEAVQDSTEPPSAIDVTDPFPVLTHEEVEQNASDARRRASSLSSGFANMSPEEIVEAKPPSPEPESKHVSAFPEQFPHGPDHNRDRSPLSNLPDYHHPSLTTLRPGPGYPRNPAADIWRDDAYEKESAGPRKMSDVEKRQDRWKCEYCGHFNERGIVEDDGEEEKNKKEEVAKKSKNKDKEESPKPPTPSPPPSPSPPKPGPIRVPLPEFKGVQPSERVECAKCHERINYGLTQQYDPREFGEDGGRNLDTMGFSPKTKFMVQRAIAEASRQRVMERRDVNERNSTRERERQRQIVEERHWEEDRERERGDVGPSGTYRRPRAEESATTDGEREAVARDSAQRSEQQVSGTLASGSQPASESPNADLESSLTVEEVRELENEGVDLLKKR